jgi:hypothetical protein
MHTRALVSISMLRFARLALAFGLATVPCGAAAVDQSAAACAPNGALSELACTLARAIARAAPNAVVVGVATPSSSAASFKPAIAANLAVKVALALGQGASAWPFTEDRAKVGRFLSPRPLVIVSARLAGDAVDASAELFAPKLAPPAAAAGGFSGDPVQRIAERHGLDAETRRFLPAVPIVMREFVRVAGSDGDIVALVCGDLDGTGVPVIASVGRTWLSFGSYAGGRYTPTSRVEQRTLAAIAPTPLREPLASAWITPERTLDFGLSDRAHATRFGVGQKPTTLTARLAWPGGGCAALDSLLISPRPIACARDEPLRSEWAWHEPLDAIAGALVIARDGSARVVRAGRQASDGAVFVADGEHDVRLDHAGAQLAVADLDGDGAPELVTSLDTLDPAADAVIVYSWLGATLTERLRVAVPAGVRALATCPEVAERMAPVVVATGNGLWVLR